MMELYVSRYLHFKLDHSGQSASKPLASIHPSSR
jgi:hypothetical protein